MPMIRVFVGSHARYAAHEPVLAYSIEANSSQPVDVRFMRARDLGQPENGCTGFSKMRWHMQRLCDGFAIYLDVDMLVIGDIAELWLYRQPGRWVTLADGSTEVMVADCRVTPRRVRGIPLEWNSEDTVQTGARLIHFTDLSRQPWFFDHHGDTEACALLDEWTERAVNAGATARMAA